LEFKFLLKDSRFAGALLTFQHLFMNRNISRLYRLAKKKSRLIIGLMSGTSLDGLDIALCKMTSSGLDTKVDVLEFQTIAYAENFKKEILNVFARKQIEFLTLSQLNVTVAKRHAAMVLRSLKKWNTDPKKIDLLASHGQTVFHAPKSITAGAKVNSTYQIGDGDHLAVGTGIITVSDFRQKHIASGGEGAPLAVYGDYLLFSRKGDNRILLNMGGIGNFTFLPSSGKANEVFVTDTGPANTLIDQAIKKYLPGKNYDRDARLAAAGVINPGLLKALLADPFFRLPFPKTAGPELFNMEYVLRAQKESDTLDINLHDLLATLTRFSAESIAAAIKKAMKPDKKYNLFLSGGGAHNPLMVQWIKELLPKASFHRMDDLGIEGDAKEAVLFAVLANEAVAGGRINFGGRAAVPTVSMGKISFPD
jgi:anhydro-N-acetylmuramic acid kinase